MIDIRTSDQAKSIIDNYDFFLLDCDGVLWLGDVVFQKIKETIEYLKSNHKTIIILTNNSTYSRSEYVEKFKKHGIDCINEKDIFGSAFAASYYTENILKLSKNKKIWILGQDGIKKECMNAGYEIISGADYKQSNLQNQNSFELQNLMNLDDSVGAVIVGLCFNINFLNLCYTMQYILKDNKKIPFIVTNTDSNFPIKGLKLIGSGSIVELLSYSTNRKPDIVCGKPHSTFMDLIKSSYPEIVNSLKRTIIIGDRLDTDILFGKNNNIDSMLVSSGIDSLSNISTNPKKTIPTYHIQKFSDLYELNHK